MSDERADAAADRQLLAAVAESDGGALRVLYERHAPWLTLRLSRRCADPEIVDEVLQDTFLAVWRKPGSFRGQGDVAAWIWGIGIRRLLDAFRRRGKDRSTPYEPTQMEDGSRTGTSAEEQVLLDVEYGDLAGALNRLSPELRAVVQATVLDGLTTREAANFLGIPRGTVKTRMMRARVQLREELA